MTQSNPQNRPQVNRALVGLIAIACLAGGITIAIRDSMDNFWCGSFIRVGLLMIAFWIAAPTKGRAAAWANVSPWWIVGSAALMLLIVRRAHVFIPLILAIVVLAIVIPGVLGRSSRRR